MYPLLEDFEKDVESKQSNNIIQDLIPGRVLSNILFVVAGFGIIIACIVFEVPYSILKDYLQTYTN